MNVTYSDGVKQSEEYPLVQRTTAELVEIIGKANKVMGRHAEEVAASWDREQDAKKGPVYVLNLSDLSGSASAPYSPDELRSGAVNLYLLWGRLMQIRTHKLIERMNSNEE